MNQLAFSDEFLGTEMQVLREDPPVDPPKGRKPRKEKGERIEHDAYYTDPRVAEFLVKLLFEREGLPCPRLALEPSCGQGAFARALQESHMPADEMLLIDIQDQAAHLEDLENCLFMQGRFEHLVPELEEVRPDLILGNPPYSQAEEHVRLSLDLVALNGTVAFLLRLAFLESLERIPFWKDHPAESVYVLSERPSFTGGGTDNCAYGFFVWRARLDARRSTTLHVVSWKG